MVKIQARFLMPLERITGVVPEFVLLSEANAPQTYPPISIANDRFSATFSAQVNADYHEFALSSEPENSCESSSMDSIAVTVRVSNLETAVADYILDSRGEGESYVPIEVRDQAATLAEECYQFIGTAFNRLVGFLRGKRHLYWLKDHNIDLPNVSIAFDNFRAQVSRDGKSWTKWKGSETVEVTIAIASSFPSIQPADWQEAADFLPSTGRFDFTFQLLANAAALAEQGQSRSAIIEAIAALEVTLSRLTSPDDAKRHFTGKYSRRINELSPAKLFGKVGLRAMVGLYLPLLLDESETTTKTLRVVERALELRNAVVHNGQREIDFEELEEMIEAILDLCSRLARSKTRSTARGAKS